MRRLTLAASLMLAAALPAQFPIGHSTPVNGFSPALFAAPLWLGNPGYGYRIQGAPPGGSVLVAISPGRLDQVISGLQIYPDVGNLILFHTAPVDAMGRAVISIPLTSPDDLSITGLQFYAQAAVSDPTLPGALGSTEAVLLEITLHPMLAFSAWAGVVWLVDPVAGNIRSVSGLPPTAQIYDLVFANAGRDLFVGSSAGLFLVDTLAVSPTAVNLSPTAGAPLAWDRVHHRLYSLNTQAITVLEGDRSSPAFGSVIAQVSVAAQDSLAISADGKVLALSSFVTGVTRRDSDPTSPNYLGLIPTAPPPFGFPPGTFLKRLHVSPDGRIVSLPLAHLFPGPNSAVHRFDGVTGTWIDHDPATPGYQPLSNATLPALTAAFDFRATQDGSALFLHGPNGLHKVDLDLAAPTNLVVTSAAVAYPIPGVDYATLTPSAHYLLRYTYGTLNPSMPVVLSLVEVSTGWTVPFVTLPGAPGFNQSAIAAWR